MEERAALCVPSGAPRAALLTARIRAGVSLLAYLPHSDRNQLNGGWGGGGGGRGGREGGEGGNRLRSTSRRESMYKRKFLLEI